MLAIDGVGNFRVELDTVEWFLVMCNGSEGGSAGIGNDSEAGSCSRDLVTVTHPDLYVYACRDQKLMRQTRDQENLPECHLQDLQRACQ